MMFRPPFCSPRFALILGSWATVILALALPALAGDAAQSQPSSDGGSSAAPAKGPPSGPPMGPPPALVRVDLVQQAEWQNRWEVVGRLREQRRTLVAAEQAGRIVEMPVEEGATVTAGQTVLARIDDVWSKLAMESAQAQLNQAKAAVSEAQASLDQSERERARLEQLLEVQSAKPKEVDDARTKENVDRSRLESARAYVHVAQAAVSKAQTDLSRLAIVAPFDGLVVHKLVEVGQWAGPGTPVVEVISRGQIDAEIDVPERLVNTLKIGDEVEVIVEPLKLETKGRVRIIVPLGAGAARTYPVRVNLDDRNGQLKAGMSVLAKVPTGEKAKVLTVSRDAVTRTATGWIAWSAANHIALPVSVDVLFGQGDRYAVRTAASNAGPPLMPDMPLVIEGQERLFPTRPLMFTLPGQTANHATPAKP